MSRLFEDISAPHMKSCLPGVSDALSEQLAALSVTEKPGNAQQEKIKNVAVEKISPSDFVSLQRLRSSALACKTSTTTKNCLDDGKLFNDLVSRNQKNKIATDATNAEQTVELQEKTVVSNEGNSKKNIKGKIGDDSVCELLARGPVRNIRTTIYQPYPSKGNISVCPQVSSGAGFNTRIVQVGCQCGIDNGCSWLENNADSVTCTSSSSTPDTVQSDQGYSSASPQHQVSPKTEFSGTRDDNQLPDDLSDFILKYSRGYIAVTSADVSTSTRSRNSSASDSAQTNYESPLYRILVEDDCKSPLSAKSAPQCSPVLPRTSAQVPSMVDDAGTSQEGCNSLSKKLPHKNDRPVRPAKNRLRALINDNDMSEAWAWTCKCVQDLRGMLCHQDPDGDSLLHIVTSHMDFAKIYALVEQMLKTDDCCPSKTFDLPNRAQETPLYLAVQRRNPEVVAYLLEAGASPNHQTLPPSSQTPLHYAVSQGMTEIVKILCADGTADVNMLNGMGLTPLLTAVKNNGLDVQKTDSSVDNKSIIRFLLKHGADPLITDLCGNSALHYAVDKLDADTIELLKSCVNEDVMMKLANMENIYGQTPLERLRCMSEPHDNGLRSNVFISLLRCGATIKSVV